MFHQYVISEEHQQRCPREGKCEKFQIWLENKVVEEVALRIIPVLQLILKNNEQQNGLQLSMQIRSASYAKYLRRC